MHLPQVKLYWVLIPCQLRWRNETWRLLYQDLLSLVSCTMLRNWPGNLASNGRAQAPVLCWTPPTKQPIGRALRSRYINKSRPNEPTEEMVRTLLGNTSRCKVKL